MGERMGILGKKLGMTQTFTEDGEMIPVTVVEAGPCSVLAIRTKEKDGYSGVQLGFDDQKKHRANRPDLVRFAKAESEPKRFVRELRLPEERVAKLEVGQTLKASEVFSDGDWVDVTGTSKGKGTQGVMKRHNFRGISASHGTHEYFRHGGSIGCSTTPARVFKGKRMPGRMGNAKVTTQNLRIVKVMDDKDILLVSGAVPGHKQGYVIVRQAVKKAAPSAAAG